MDLRQCVATFVRLLIQRAWDKVKGEGQFAKRFGESETTALVKSIYNFFKGAIQIGLVVPSLKFMMEYIQQKPATKKLA